MKKKIVLFSLLLGTLGLANCSGDDDATPVQDGGLAGGDAAGEAGGNRPGTDGSTQTGGTKVEGGVDAMPGNDTGVPETGTDATPSADGAVDVNTNPPDSNTPDVNNPQPEAGICPTAKPQHDTECPVNLRSTDCMFGATKCRCRSTTTKWECTEPTPDSGAPDVMVDANDAAPDVTSDVASDVTNDVTPDVTADVVTSDVVDAGDAGDASTDAAVCPAQAPADDSDCTGSGLLCDYAGTSCTCRGSTRKWICAPESDAALNDAGCPISAVPADGTFCPVRGQDCTIGTVSCHCHSNNNPNTWTCQ